MPLPDLVPQRGYIISNADDAGARDSVKGLQHPVFTFAVQDRTADCVADNVSFFDGCPVFDVVIHGEVYAHVELKIPRQAQHPQHAGSGVGSVCAGSARRGGIPWAGDLPRRRPPHGAQGDISWGGGLRRLRPPSR